MIVITGMAKIAATLSLSGSVWALAKITGNKSGYLPGIIWLKIQYNLDNESLIEVAKATNGQLVMCSGNIQGLSTRQAEILKQHVVEYERDVPYQILESIVPNIYVEVQQSSIVIVGDQQIKPLTQRDEIYPEVIAAKCAMIDKINRSIKKNEKRYD